MEIKVIIEDSLLEKEFNDVGLSYNPRLIIEFKEWMEKDFWEWYKDNLKSFLIEKTQCEIRSTQLL